MSPLIKRLLQQKLENPNNTGWKKNKLGKIYPLNREKTRKAS